MSINTVIFDFDGTLANTNQVVINSWQHTYRKIHGKEQPVDQIIKTFGEPLWISMEKAFPGENVDDLVDIYRDYQKNHFKEMIEMFPGMELLVSQLKERKYSVAIVTSRTRETTIRGLEKFGIIDLIDEIVSCDDTKKHKPDPEPVNIALRRLNILPEEAVMVGDSMFDILCAHNAGVKAILVDWAVAVSEEEMEGPDGPDYTIKNGDELFEII